MIASDTGDLMLDTGSFEYSNIKGNDRSYNVGGGVNVGGNSSKAGDDPVKNKVTYNVRGNYGFSDSRQTNFATIGEGNITVRDGGSTDKLNRDTTATQIITSDTGMKGGATVDSDTINLLTTNPVTTVDNAIDSAAGIAFKAITDGANVVNDTMVVAEKTGNLIEYKHFTTDDKVQYCLNMDDYEEKKANGGEITALDTLVYVKSKSAAGYELDRSDVSDLRLASRYVIDDATNGILENLKANIRVNSREDVNASLAVLDRFDSEDAAAARAYLAGVRSENERQNIRDEISKVDPNLLYSEKDIRKVQELIKNNAVVCIQTEDKVENQYYVLTKNDGVQLNGKGEKGKAVYTVNTSAIEYVVEKEGILSTKLENSTSGQSVAKIDYSSSVTGSDSVYGGVNTKGAVIGLSHSSADLTSNGSSAYTEMSLTVTGKGAAAGVVLVGATVIIKNPTAATWLVTELIPAAVPVLIQIGK